MKIKLFLFPLLAILCAAVSGFAQNFQRQAASSRLGRQARLYFLKVVQDGRVLAVEKFVKQR